MEDGMNGLSVLAIGAILLPLSAGAAPTAISVQSAAPSAVQPTASEKRVCRTMTDLGSIIPRHICATRKQWDEVVRANEGDQDILRFSQHPNSPQTQCLQEHTC
jgi:hypothetical protein